MIKMTRGATGKMERSNKRSIIGAEVFTTIIDITNNISPINIEPESPIKTLSCCDPKLNGI
jgi:hypothetical protein